MHTKNEKKNIVIFWYLYFVFILSYLLVTVCYCHLFIHFFANENKLNKMFNVDSKTCIKTYLNATIMRRFKKKCSFFFLFVICNLKKANKDLNIQITELFSVSLSHYSKE